MMARWPEDEPRFTGLVKFDLDTGRYQAFSEGPHFWYSEAPFADPPTEAMRVPERCLGWYELDSAEQLRV